MKKILTYIGLGLYAVAAIGGLWVAVSTKAHFTAACVAVLAGFAIPTAKKLLNNIME